MSNGVAQKPIEGVSMVYTFDDAKAPVAAHQTSTSRCSPTAPSTSDGWVAATTPTAPPWVSMAKSVDPIDDYQWELYNVAEDFTQAVNLAARNPEKLRELQELF